MRRYGPVANRCNRRNTGKSRVFCCMCVLCAILLTSTVPYHTLKWKEKKKNSVHSKGEEVSTKTCHRLTVRFKSAVPDKCQNLVVEFLRKCYSDIFTVAHGDLNIRIMARFVKFSHFQQTFIQAKFFCRNFNGAADFSDQDKSVHTSEPLERERELSELFPSPLIPPQKNKHVDFLSASTFFLKSKI